MCGEWISAFMVGDDISVFVLDLEEERDICVLKERGPPVFGTGRSVRDLKRERDGCQRRHAICARCGATY